jgi:hypothetical protein
VLLAVFTLSGFTGLIYESIWSHYLKLFLGHAAYAQTLVLAIFMGGMAIGAHVIGRYSQRIRRLLIAYAVVELAIGVFGLLFHPVFERVLDWSFLHAIPALGSPASVQLFKWTAGTLLLLPPSILMGATFPLISGGLVRLTPHRSGELLALLYFTNCLGAAVGVLVSGFFLPCKVGLPGTLLTAGLLNILLALVVAGMASPPARAGARISANSPRHAFRPCRADRGQYCQESVQRVPPVRSLPLLERSTCLPRPAASAASWRLGRLQSPTSANERRRSFRTVAELGHRILEQPRGQLPDLGYVLTATSAALYGLGNHREAFELVRKWSRRLPADNEYDLALGILAAAGTVS